MSGSYIIEGARTPIGKLSGAFASLTAVELGGFAIKGALERSNVAPDEVDMVIMGQVILAGTGQMSARQAAVNAGIPMSVPSTTINKVCLSGLHAIYLAHQIIAAGDADIVVAGGMESMTKSPHLLIGAREGFRLGDAPLVDSLLYDGLTCAFDQCAMGLSTEQHNAKYAIDRKRQDEMSLLSHQRAAAAKDRLAQEIIPVSVPQRKGDPIIVSHDEGVRDTTTMESLGNLRPAFAKDGTITAGNASQISDGAAAVVVMSKKAAEARGIKPLGELLGYGQVAGPDASLQLQPANATKKALARVGMTIKDIDIFEINEAFAAVGLASMDDLGISADVLNVNGGAIALGHPVGMSGARLALTSLYELRRRGGGVAAVSLCGGGGQGDGAILRAMA
jgi:acetyl-CoA C-acetyltransferase